MFYFQLHNSAVAGSAGLRLVLEASEDPVLVKAGLVDLGLAVDSHLIDQDSGDQASVMEVLQSAFLRVSA